MNKIGFKYNNSAEQSSEVVAAAPAEERNIPMSPAHADLVETIENLAGLIISKEFSRFEETQKILFVKQLINASALNAELTAKTNLLIG